MLLFLALRLASADPAAFDGTVARPEAGQPAARPSGFGGSIGAIPAEVAAVAEQVRNQPLPDRIAVISTALLGRPYVNDPMGEGTGVDPDPFARYDAFDCLTFVEEVLALSLAGDPEHAAEVRTSLRYGAGPADYVHRRHFMELQWVPGVVRDGWMRVTTGEYGKTVVLDKEVTAETWKSWAPRKNFAHTDEQLPIGTMHLEVLPLDEAAKAVSRIRPGSMMLTVRTDRAGVPLWITHVGLILHDAEGQPITRHATKIGTGGTRDHGLAWYIDHLRTYDNWTVLGIAILEPVEQGPRIAALPR